MIVAVPFLWRPLPWKRLLAYSSLEHMGVLALGIGFGSPLAIAGVVLHVAGHGLAKALGFYAALPLLRADPDAAHRAPPAWRARARRPRRPWASVSCRSGLPPSPVFVSELLILLGGVEAGETAVVAVAAVALALGFLGLLHALIEGVAGEPRQRHGSKRLRSERPILVLTGVLGAGLLALTVAGPSAARLAVRRDARAGSAVRNGGFPAPATTVERVPAGCLARQGRGGARRRWAIRGCVGDRARMARTLRHPGRARVLTCEVPDRVLDTIVDLVPAAGWDEREAHDQFGLAFTGHEPMRALLAHPDDSQDWMTPVTGDGVHQVAVGPIHAGVIESGHFRFHVVGERILALDPRLFYKHRGLQRAAEGRTPGEALAYAQRACAGCAVTNTRRVRPRGRGRARPVA